MFSLINIACLMENQNRSKLSLIVWEDKKFMYSRIYFFNILIL